MNCAGTGMGREPETPDSLAKKTKLHALLVEDSLADGELVLRELHRGGFDVTTSVVQTPEEFRQRVKETFPDVVLADYNLGEWRGM
jgi:CheY-like chemotaxis protein